MAQKQDCTAKESCIFLGRDLGWEKLEVEENPRAHLHPPVIPHNANTSSIYLTMSSFRDKLCPYTLYYLFTKAAHPGRVNVGIVQQNTADDVDCLEHYCELMKNASLVDVQLRPTQEFRCPFEDNIRITRIDATEARGPTWARAQGSLLMQDEEFCMQTDSHMDFVPDWDVHMTEMWRQTGNEYAVLSTYVADSATLKDNLPGKRGTNGVFEVPHLCMVTFSGGYGMVRNWGTKCMRNMPRPKLTNMVWGAGLSFSKCHAERKAPYDPHTPHIFDGEEFSRALRFWTWGYDIYSPHRVYVVHNYVESQSDPKHSGWAASKISWQQRNEEILASTTRLRMLMEMPPEPQFARGADGTDGAVAGSFDAAAVLALQQSRFGLGDRRSLSQAIDFSGIDTRQRKMVGNKCGNLELVPFVEHPWGAEYVPKYDATSEAYADVRDPGSIYFDSNDVAMREAWETVDRQRLQVQDRPLSDRLDRTITQPMSTTKQPPLHNIRTAVPQISNNAPIYTGERIGGSSVSTSDKMALNLACLLIIAVIIIGRVFVYYRSRILKVTATYMSLSEGESIASGKNV